MADELDVKETIIYNLNKYAISYESKTKRCLLIDGKHQATIKWLIYIFTDGNKIKWSQKKDIICFSLDKDYLNLKFYDVDTEEPLSQHLLDKYDVFNKQLKNKSPKYNK